MGAMEATHLRLGGITALASSDNERGQGFFGSLGYQQVGTLPAYIRPGLDELIYYKA